MTYTVQVGPRCFVKANLNSNGEVEMLEIENTSIVGFGPSYLRDSFRTLSGFIGTEEELKETVKAKIKQSEERKEKRKKAYDEYVQARELEQSSIRFKMLNARFNRNNVRLSRGGHYFLGIFMRYSDKKTQKLKNKNESLSRQIQEQYDLEPTAILYKKYNTLKGGNRTIKSSMIKDYTSGVRVP